MCANYKVMLYRLYVPDVAIERLKTRRASKKERSDCLQGSRPSTSETASAVNVYYKAAGRLTLHIPRLQRPVHRLVHLPPDLHPRKLVALHIGEYPVGE